MLLFGAGLGLLVFLFILPMAIENRLWHLIFWDGLMWACAVVLLFQPRMNYTVRASLAVLFSYIIGLAVIFSAGPMSGGPAWLFCFAVVAGVLLGFKAAVGAVLINAATISIVGYLMVNHMWGATFPFFQSERMMYVAGINYLFLNALAAVSVSVLVRGLTQSHEKEKQLIVSLKQGREMLEAEIQERKQAEEKYRDILESIEDGYYEVDLGGHFIFFNPSMGRILGYTEKELMGMNNRAYMDRENAAKIYKTFHQVFLTGVPTKALDWQLIRKDGTICSVETVVSLIRDSVGTPIGFRGIARDISHRRQLERQLQQAHKMESIGTLAGGMAHDFNNLLYIIMGNTELAMHEIPKTAPMFLYLDRIQSACLRAADVVKQLLNFSRETDPVFKPLDVVGAVKEEIRFLRAMIPSSVEIRQTLPKGLIRILADRTQFRQVLMNICTNAFQAMEKSGGVIDIHVTRIRLDKNLEPQFPDLPSGDYVLIEIRDTGPGISGEHLDRIFDPYFTTREVGKGSGMGLAVVHGIVTRHKGAVTVSSQPGKGAVFQIFFPVVEIL